MAEVKKKIWDLDRLMDNADGFAVAERIGIRKKRHGSITYIECVDGTHKESDINHCQLFRDGCHCYSCGSSHNVYGMIRSYYANILGTPLEHDEICSIIAETCGGEDEYLIHPDSHVKRKPFPLTKEELAAIGLSAESRRAEKIAGYSEEKDEEHSVLSGCDGYVKLEYLPPMSIYSLFRENEEMFRIIVAGKIRESAEKTQKIYRSFKTRKDPLSQALVRAAVEQYNLTVSVRNKIFPSNKKQAVS